ncbi:MAG: hypothetical protein H6563_12225 [Lewinellaceae bacterium]|nr:hypothetical protein [Lewinellaceae bacterium]
MRHLLFLVLAAWSLTACNQPPKNPATDTPAPASAAPAAPAETLPGVPMEILQNLWENCDGVDYVYYDLPISMSLDNQPSIRNALSQVAKQPAPMQPQCKPIGRIFFMIKGENVVVAELYFSKGCTYFIFLENEKPTYSNYMTPQGVEYFNNIFRQAGYPTVE